MRDPACFLPFDFFVYLNKILSHEFSFLFGLTNLRFTSPIFPNFFP